MRESTKELIKKHGWRIDKAIHNYVYFAFYYPYVKIVYHVFRLLTEYFYWVKPLSLVIKTAFDRYHAKILSFNDTKKIFDLNEDVLAISERNKRIVPFKYAYKIILQEPDFIAVMDCPCKKTLNAPEWTINSCISVGRKTSEFWLDRCGKKYHARKITQKQALDLIKKFRKNGYLTQVFFKVATGGTAGVICNCHIDTCVSLKATQFAKRFDKDLSMSAESGYSVSHDDERCKACGTCEDICQFRAIQVQDGIWSYNKDICMGCGLCSEHCPEQAISLYPDPDKAVPLDLDIVRAEYASD